MSTYIYTYVFHWEQSVILCNKCIGHARASVSQVSSEFMPVTLQIYKTFLSNFTLGQVSISMAADMKASPVTRRAEMLVLINWDMKVNHDLLAGSRVRGDRSRGYVSMTERVDVHVVRKYARHVSTANDTRYNYVVYISQKCKRYSTLLCYTQTTTTFSSNK